ncbi:MAG: winged helix-turn-helix domain-containing protein [Vicinamibacterales bacterium]
MERGSTVRVGAFELDLRSRELRSDAGRRRLQEQPFEILRALVSAQGTVVTREDLCRSLWPDGTFVDFEHSLNAAVKRLRAALGDDAVEPRYIETIPRRGYRLIAAVEGAPATGAGAPQGRAAGRAHTARLAVLPFANLSEDPGQQYFSDGLTEEMIAQLGRICGRRIGVLARWSSMLFRDGARSVREIGDALRADYLLEGSVRRDGERVRITARLVETAGETHLWADTYERTLADCLSVQTDVAKRIADSLASELMPKARDTPRLDPAQAGAYQAYLKGRYHWNRPGDEGLLESIAYFDEAVALDPALAPAHASRARALVARAEYYQEPVASALPRARASAERALELDPAHWRAHVALGDIHRLLDWNWAGAEASYRRATELNPNSESAHRAYAVLLAVTGRFDAAIEEVDRAVALDPLCLVVGTSAAWVRYVAGDYAAVIERCRHSIEMDERYGYSLARRLLSAACLQTGRAAEAVDLLELARATSGDEPLLLAWLVSAHARAGDRAEAEALLRRLEGMPVPAYHLALAYAGVGDADAACAALERACDLRDPAVGQTAVEPRFGELRHDPRFAAVVARLGLAPAVPRHPLD